MAKKGTMHDRDIMSKPQTMFDGMRARWVAVGLVMMLIVLVCDIIQPQIDPAPYLQTIMVLIGAGVLGWSVDSAAKIMKVESLNQTVTETQVTTTSNNENKTVTVSVDTKKEEDIDIKQDTTITENYNENIIIEDTGEAPVTRPYSQLAKEE